MDPEKEQAGEGAVSVCPSGSELIETKSRYYGGFVAPGASQPSPQSAPPVSHGTAPSSLLGGQGEFQK